jgi:hypothetical protein
VWAQSVRLAAVWKAEKACLALRLPLGPKALGRVRVRPHELPCWGVGTSWRGALLQAAKQWLARTEAAEQAGREQEARAVRALRTLRGCSCTCSCGGLA